MYKLANQVLDAHDDAERATLKKLAKFNPKINMLTNDEVANLQDDDFALTIITKRASKLNKYPVESHDSTWLSNQYFNEHCYKLPKEAAEVAAHNIKIACEKFNIAPTPAVASMAKEADSNIYYERDIIERQDKTLAADLTKFAQVREIGDNYTFAQYAFPTLSHVKLANIYFNEHHDKMPVEYRHKYACSLQRRAGELGETLKGKITKYASNAYNAHVDAHLISRKTLVNDKFAEALDKLASMKEKLQPIEFANVLHAFDKKANLEKYYGGYLVNPYEATFATQVNPKAIYKSASHSLSEDSLSKAVTEKYAKIKEYFGKDIADVLKKEGMPVFESLPNDAKEIIAGIVDGSL